MNERCLPTREREGKKKGEKRRERRGKESENSRRMSRLFMFAGKAMKLADLIVCNNL